MEENINKKIYFIFSQKGSENIPYQLEKNEIIKDISKLESVHLANYNYTIYSITFYNNPNINSFSLLLLIQNEFFIAQIECNKIYPEIFLYEVEFKPMNENTTINLNQIILPYSEQFALFKKHITNNENLLKYLILNSFDFIIASNNKIKFEFYFFLYLFGNSLYLNIETSDKTLLSTFFDTFNTDLIEVKNSYIENYHYDEISGILSTEVIQILSDTEMIYSLISSLDLNDKKKDENYIINTLDIILAYYYINFYPKKFIQLVLKNENNPRAELISENLKKNRKIFKNFSSEIINFKLLDEAEHLNQIYYVILLVPDIPELFKIVSENMMFLKLTTLCLLEGKVLNVYKIVKPKKEDNIQYLYDNFLILFEFIQNEGHSPLSFVDELFIDYCELFYKIDLNKIQIIIDIYNKIKSITKREEIIIDELYPYYYETGIHLIKTGKLVNQDLFSFIRKIKILFNKEIEITPEIGNGLIPSEDPSFLDSFLNLPNSILETYPKLSKYFFNKFALKDILTLEKWDMSKCNNFFVLKDCLECIKNILIKEKDSKINKNQISFIASFLCHYFRHFKSDKDIFEFQNIEKEINSVKVLLYIYSFILIKKYAEENSLLGFKEHIFEYIQNHYHEVGVLGLYYKLIITDECDQDDFLKNNLNIEYAIKLQDFYDYPNKFNVRFLLFKNLYNGSFLKGDIIDTDYYKASVSTKDKLAFLEYKYALNVSKNSEDFLILFLYFIPYKAYCSGYQDYEWQMAKILFDFNDLLNYWKKKYNSLKVILIYWKHFFNYTKSKDILSLEDFIQKLDNTPLNEFQKYELQFEDFLLDLKDAESNDKLYNSFIFMGIYTETEDIFSNEEENEKFKYTLMQFNEMKIFGGGWGVDDLPKELVAKVVELTYKNMDRVDDEIEFIKEFFMLIDNPNFDKNRIKRNLLDKVNNYKINHNLDDYKIQFDNFNLIEESESIINNNQNNINIDINTTEGKNNDLGGFSLFGNDIEEEEDISFNLLGNNEPKNEIKNENTSIKKQKIEKTIIKGFSDDELNEILKDLNKMSCEYYNIYKIFISYEDIEDRINLDDKYDSYFWKIFSEINKYNILTNQLFYEKVILTSMKLFLSGTGINYFKNENNNKKDMYLIYEFFEILELYKKYNLLNKPKLFKVIERIIECKESSDNDIVNIMESLEHLFSEIGENIQKKSVTNLLIRILCFEKNKIDMDEFNNKILNFVFRDDNNYLINDIAPLLDEIFKDKINIKLNIKDDIENEKYIFFDSPGLSTIDKKINNLKDDKQVNNLEELILYYFESKITYIFLIMKKEFENVRDFYQNEKIKKLLQKGLFLLEEEFFKNLNINNKSISLLFSIAFIKCFLSDYIHYLIFNNQEIGDVYEINSNIINGNGNNAFRVWIKLYIMKLIYNVKGNYPEFNDFNISKYQMDYYNDKEIILIKEQKEKSEIKFYGFDYLFLPLKQNEFKEFVSIEKIFFNLGLNNENNENEENIISSINNIANLDILLCSIINNFISNFHYNRYFQSNEYKNISAFLYNNIVNNKFNKINNIAKDILLLFIDKKNFEEKVLKYGDIYLGKISYSYNQILSISFSLRLVFNTILNNNPNSLFYQILLGNEKIFEKNDSFIHYYNKDFNSYKFRNINNLTFSIIRYIIFSHIYFGYLLDKINISNINDIFINLEENFRIIDLIEKELNHIKKILALKGIKNIIVFMNYVFNDIISKMVNISSEDYNDKSTIISIETDIENVISKYLENFDYYCEEYNQMITSENMDKYQENEFRNIIIENKEFYNEKNIEKKYPFIKYFTLTNFCGIDDFKNQFLYLTQDKFNYPLINCLMNNDDVITIIRYLPFINKFFNEISNELMLKIKREDINKNIKSILSENIMNQLNDYNSKIKEINKLKSFEKNKINEINNDTKIIEVINIKDNSINKIFYTFIKIYNEFLTNTKIYKDNKDIIDPIIIQEATKNDYISFTNINNEQDYYNDNDKNDISIYDRLNELLVIYSKRARYNNKNALNVYNGSKINYDLTQIENILEKEYLYGKRAFKNEQRNFIFSDEVFSQDRNNLIESLIQKYPQEKFDDEMMMSEYDKFLNDKNKTKNDFERIYISIQYMIISLMEYNFNQNEKISLEYISKILRRNNYLICDLLMEFFNNYNNVLYINNLLFLYEKIELKYFVYISADIGNSIIKDKNYDINYNDKMIIENYFKNNENQVIKEEILLDSCKKYIMRYSKGSNEELTKIELNNIFEKECIWYFFLKEKDNENKFNDEKKILLKLNDKENILMKFLFKKLFALDKNMAKNNLQDSMMIAEYDEEAERIRKRKKGRNRNKRRMLDYY